MLQDLEFVSQSMRSLGLELNELGTVSPKAFEVVITNVA